MSSQAPIAMLVYMSVDSRTPRHWQTTLIISARSTAYGGMSDGERAPLDLGEADTDEDNRAHANCARQKAHCTCCTV